MRTTAFGTFKYGLAVLFFLMLIPAFAQSDGEKEPRELKKFLTGAVRNKDVDLLASSLSDLVDLNNREAVEVISYVVKKYLRSDKYREFYWPCVRALASFTDPDALEGVAIFTLKHEKNIGKDIVFELVNNNHSHTAITFYRIVLPRGEDDIRIALLDHAPSIPTAAMVDLLVSMLASSGGAVNERIVMALEVITGQVFGMNELNWRGWWDKHRDGWEPPGELIGAAGKKSRGQDSVTGILDPARDFQLKKDLKKDLIVVLTSRYEGVCKYENHNFDKIEKVLAKMGIPHTVITKEEFENTGYRLDGKIALLVNCNMFEKHCVCPECKVGGSATGARRATCVGCTAHEYHETMLSMDAVNRVKSFVESGGYLFTEDWELKEVIERAWGNLASVGEYIKEDFVDVISPSGLGTHQYLRKIFSSERYKSAGPSTGVVPEPEFELVEHEWKIDDGSPLIKVTGKGVITLLESRRLADETDDNALAITFIAGDNRKSTINTGQQPPLREMKGGRVLHVLSHFGRQKSQKDEFAIQNLLINFLIEAIQRYIQQNRALPKRN